MLGGILFVVAVALLALGSAFPEGADVLVQTAYGPVRGLRNDSTGLTSFLGVRYAAAPVGALRFAPPHAPAPWTAPADATAYGASCMAGLSPSFGYPLLEYAEDCLFLNVITPASALPPHSTAAAATSLLPVFVWIYGGGFQDGSSTIYPPWNLARHGVDAGTPVVVVTLNYRVNIFGFLAFDAGSPDGEAVANAGLLDQRFALQWVQQNIAAFGGDPSRVTIAGESAGGASVAWHLVAKASWPLFDAAILESPGPWTFPSAAMLQASLAPALASAFGCANSAAALLPCLRAATAANLLDFAEHSKPLQPLPVWGGRASDLQAPPPKLWADPSLGGAVRPGVRVLLGSNLAEGNLLIALALNWTSGTGVTHIPQLTQAQFFGYASLALNGVPTGLAKEVLSWYADYSDYTQALLALGGDYWITCGARMVSDRAVAMGASALFRYQFRHATRRWLFAELNCTHTSELAYVFMGDMQAVEFDADEVALSREFASAWLAFATDGAPGNASSWPHYSTGTQTAVVLDLPSSYLASDAEITPQCANYQQDVYMLGY